MSLSQNSLSRVREQLERMRSVATAAEADFYRAAPAVSGWCAAEHLDHMAKVTSSMLERLAERDAPRLPKGITAVGRVILALGRIPRGKGQAPERLRGLRISAADLLAALQTLDALLATLDPALLEQSALPTVRHAKFGGLNAAQALRFVAIHNDHHLRIIDDIARASRAR